MVTVHIVSQYSVASLYHCAIFPQTHLPTEVARVFGVLRDLNLLDHLSERGSITGSILTHYADLLRSFGLEGNRHIGQ